MQYPWTWLGIYKTSIASGRGERLGLFCDDTAMSLERGQDALSLLLAILTAHALQQILHVPGLVCPVPAAIHILGEEDIGLPRKVFSVCVSDRSARCAGARNPPPSPTLQPYGILDSSSREGAHAKQWKT
ncbi:hypothetical protein VTN02DRAFT_5863 [Thermoascus thermophilus]